nr:hypothetical protein [Tanacetum cinerariifolium]
PGLELPAHFSPIYFPMGNAATGFFVTFSLIAGVASAIAGFGFIRSWNSEGQPGAASAADIAWVLTLLSMGFAWKEIELNGRNAALVTPCEARGDKRDSSLLVPCFNHKGPGLELPAHFSPIYFPMGNAATGFFVTFSLIAGVASAIAGFGFIRSWNSEGQPGAASAADIAWVLTLLSMGFAWKEIELNGRNAALEHLDYAIVKIKEIFCARMYKGIRIDDSLSLSYLFYVDDTVFIGKWNKANVITIVNMLKCFYLTSGLKINIHKSKIMGIGTSHEEVDSAARIIRCNTFSLPFNYLGVKWKLKTLSIAGRFTLTKSVLSSLPIYQMSLYKTPIGVLRKMESIRRRFFNGVDINENKMSMIGWEKVMASRKKGGSISRSSTWINITRECNLLSSKGINLLSHMKKKVGNGMNTLFWVDVWLTGHSPNAFIPTPPRGGLEEEEFSNLIEDVKQVILSSSNDMWIWSLVSSGEFSVKSTRLFIDDYLLPTRKYTLQLIERAHMVNCNHFRTPLDTESKLGSEAAQSARATFYRSQTYLALRSWDFEFCAEAEYRGVANVVTETTWLRNLLRELHSSLSTITFVYYDNVNAIYMSDNLVQHQQTKHIKTGIHFVCDMVTAGQ